MAPTGTLLPAGGFPCNPDLSETDSPLQNFQFPRSDCDWNLARLYREIVCRDRPDTGCTDGNAALARTLKCHNSSVRDWLVLLKKMRLVEVEIQGNRRTVRPLVPLVDLFPLWPTLARACVTTLRLCKAVRAAARRAQGVISASVSRCAQPKSAPLPQRTPRLSPDSSAGNKRQRHTPSPLPTPAVVAPESLHEALALGIPRTQAARILADKPLATVRQAVGAVSSYLKRKPGNPAALLTVALREGWTPSLPPSAHASDHGERSVRIVQAPAGFALRGQREIPPAPLWRDDLPAAVKARLSRRSGGEA